MTEYEVYKDDEPIGPYTGTIPSLCSPNPTIQINKVKYVVIGVCNDSTVRAKPYIRVTAVQN